VADAAPLHAGRPTVVMVGAGGSAVVEGDAPEMPEDE
jgi:hypothetical protein